MVRLDDEAEQIALERARLMLTDAQDELERMSSSQNSGAGDDRADPEANWPCAMPSSRSARPNSIWHSA